MSGEMLDAEPGGTDNISGLGEHEILPEPRSLQQVLGEAIASVLRVHAPPASLFAPAAMQQALAAELALLQRGTALRLKSSQSDSFSRFSLCYDWAIALRLYPHLLPGSACSLPHWAATLTDRFHLRAKSPSPCHQPPASASSSGASLFQTQEIWANCSIASDQKGLLQVSVGDRALALWLQEVLRCTVGAEPNLAQAIAHPAIDPARQFWMQAAHARSCSLLRQGAVLGLLPAAIADDLSIDLSAEFVETLVVQCFSAEREARLPPVAQHPEWDLLYTSITVLDGWAIASPTRRWNLAQQMSQSIWAFDAACRLLADATKLLPNRSQMRFLALIIACKVLRKCLNILGLEAPTTL